MLLALVVTALAAQAAPLAPGKDAGSTARTAEQLARAAQQLRGDATIATTLRTAHVCNDVAERALTALGFGTALDLRLLAGGPEAVELMATLRAGGELGVADRAKIRLLVGDREHLARVLALSSPIMSAAPHDVQGKRVAMDSTPHQSRQLQDAAIQGGMSPDTIAIVLSVLVGAAGYLVQAYTARRAERSLAEQAQEQHAWELARQREQEMTVAQIARTERWVDEFCSPVFRLLTDYNQGRVRFVNAIANKLEATQPEAFAELYKGYSMKGLEVKDDGSIHGFGQILLEPSNKGLTFGTATLYESFYAGGSTAALDVQSEDFWAWMKYACVRELPEAFLDLMAADLDGPLAEDYRGHIRHEVKPIFDVIKDIFHAHYAAIEAPPQEWVAETFPGSSKSASSGSIPGATVAYGRAWDRVLAEWDAGRLDTLRPPNHMLPGMALYKFVLWSRERGETKQHELIGMSSGGRHQRSAHSRHVVEE